MWGSALTDHAVKENLVIDWESATIVEKEREDLARDIKEAIYIRKLPNLNRDEGRYHLSHLYDNLLGAVAHTYTVQYPLSVQALVPTDKMAESSLGKNLFTRF